MGTAPLGTCVLLGGRAAEELVFGEVSTGTESDLQRATDLARQMITRYGMSESLGPAVFEQLRAPLLLPDGAPRRSDYSDRTAEKIDEEMRALLQCAQRRVSETLAGRRSELEAVARILLQKETIDRPTLLGLLGPGSRATPADARSADAPVERLPPARAG